MMRWRQLRRRKDRRATLSVTDIERSVAIRSAFFSLACASARRANSCASSEASCRSAASRSASDKLSSALRRSEKRATMAAMAPACCDDSAASMALTAARRVARWLATSRSISASCTAATALRLRALKLRRSCLIWAAVRFSRTPWLGLPRVSVTGPAPTPYRGRAPSSRRRHVEHVRHQRSGQHCR